MPPRSGVQLLFVPCSPRGSNQISSEDESQPSWQKHASRQYHSWNKLARPKSSRTSRAARRAAQPYIPVREIQSKGSISTDVATNDDLRETRKDEFSPIGEIACDQIDPFGVIIRPDTPKYAIEILQHGVHLMWNAFDRGTGAGRIKNTILTSAMISPATFYTVVFSAAAHNAFQYSKARVPEQNKLLRIRYKGLALTHLQQEISALGNAMAITDELLLCMVILAAHSGADTLSPPEDEHRMKGALTKAQDNEYYGTLTWESNHLSALRTLVVARGGLETVLLPGVREMFCVADLLEAWKMLQCPFFPAAVPTEMVLSKLNRFFPEFGYDDYQLPKGFYNLLDIVSLMPILKTVRYLQLVMKSYEDFEARESYAPTIQDLYVACNAVLHETLSHDKYADSNRSDSGYGSVAPSPTSADDNNTNSEAMNNILHILIRYTCLASILQALLPFPHISGIQLKLASAFRDSLEHLKLLDGWVKYPELTLWAAILAGTVASGTTRLYFANVCLTCEASCRSPEFIDSDITEVSQWQNMINVCREFLWYEGAESPLQTELPGFRKLIFEAKSNCSTPTPFFRPV